MKVAKEARNLDLRTPADDTILLEAKFVYIEQVTHHCDVTIYNRISQCQVTSDENLSNFCFEYFADHSVKLFRKGYSFMIY